MSIKRTRIEELYEEGFWNEDTQLSSPSDVFSFTEIRSCADIYRMYSGKILDVQPDFQRDVVWRDSDKTRFIDSIIKGLPIPSLCFSYDSVKQKWLVIDGLQRIATIIAFLDGADAKYSKLDDVDQRIAGRSPFEIKGDESSADIVTRIENCSLPITVLRCDYERKDHLAFLFTVFHRLNSTGIKLNNQEIRNCIYAGAYNQMLRNLDKNSEWMKLNKKSRNKFDRMRTQELILRFFAFQDNLESYEGKLVSFLNDYMGSKKDISESEIADYTLLFNKTVSLLYKLIDASLIEKERISPVVQDAILYGLAKNIDQFSMYPLKEQAEKVNVALKNEVFSEEQLSGGIMKKNKLLNRLHAIEESLR